MSECCLIYAVCANEAEADKIGLALVSNDLAACVNIIPAIRSIYKWRGEVKQADEVVLIAKIALYRQDDVVSFIKEAHSYECPAIIVIPITGGYEPFLSWVSNPFM